MDLEKKQVQFSSLCSGWEHHYHLTILTVLAIAITIVTAITIVITIVTIIVHLFTLLGSIRQGSAVGLRQEEGEQCTCLINDSKLGFFELLNFKYGSKMYKVGLSN